jgi:hypothetical protein
MLRHECTLQRRNRTALASSIVRRRLLTSAPVVRPRSSARYHHRLPERLSLRGAPHARPVLSAARRERSARVAAVPAFRTQFNGYGVRLLRRRAHKKAPPARCAFAACD